MAQREVQPFTLDEYIAAINGSIPRGRDEKIPEIERSVARIARAQAIASGICERNIDGTLVQVRDFSYGVGIALALEGRARATETDEEGYPQRRRAAQLLAAASESASLAYIHSPVDHLMRGFFAASLIAHAKSAVGFASEWQLTQWIQDRKEFFSQAHQAVQQFLNYSEPLLPGIPISFFGTYYQTLALADRQAPILLI